MKANIFYALNEIDDKYILEVPQYTEKKKRRAFGAVAAILCVIILNITHPVLARSIPFVGSVFEYVQNKLDFAGEYDKYASNVGKIVTSRGITVEIQEVYCDGENLFVSYQVQSEKPFSEYTTEEYLKTQLDFDGLVWATSEGKNLPINDFGVSGLEGDFTDENTFVGVDTVRLTEGEFPEEFSYSVQVLKWKLLSETGTDISLNGYWDLSMPVKVNKSDVKVIKVNASERQHNIDKVVVSPIMATIYTSYPEIYNESVNYDVVVFSEVSNENIHFQAEYGDTTGKTWIPRSMIGENLDIYVVDCSTFALQGVEAYKKAEIEKHAIFSAHVDLK